MPSYPPPRGGYYYAAYPPNIPVLLLTSRRCIGLTLANDAKSATSWGTRNSFARSEWVEDTSSPPRCPPDLRHLARGAPPLGRQASSSRGPTRTGKHVSPLPPPTIMLCSHIVPTPTPNAKHDSNNNDDDYNHYEKEQQPQPLEQYQQHLSYYYE